MIEHLVGFADNVVAFRCLGRVTKADYISVLVPVVAEALHTPRKVRLYYETGPDFSLDPAAAWEDLKVGMESIARWERIAVVTAAGGSSTQCFASHRHLWLGDWQARC
jgi:SpoIIAA-like